ncbi:MAG: preprotein translocase subunit SecA [Enterobacterales bacterium]|jgi:preprotein translocase subunit SecA
MFGQFLTKIFGSRNQRLLKTYNKAINKIKSYEEGYKALSDEELKAKTVEFKERIEKGETEESILPEAFAVVREASVRTIGLRHFDVQMVGGMVLNDGKIAEMRTGEGKTLVATLPSYLNAISGEGVHVITVNDYLASRDANWMRPVYEFLGMSVGVILSGQDIEEKRSAYNCDITYGTNNEYGFDYLRDNMAFSIEEKVQRDLHYAVIDEVDSILIDEARTPLIISGAVADSSEMYTKINVMIPELEAQTGEVEEGQESLGNGDYHVDEKSRQVYLTEQGQEHVEEMLAKMGLLSEGSVLYSAANIALLHHINAALRANVCYQRDVDYIIENDEVVIVDEHTGRTMAGRRWSEGLHQAVEAKENVNIQSENQTLASITFQNLFRLYDKLSGMTGTADTEAFELRQIYSLEVVVIPTNQPMTRDDRPDLVFLTQAEKSDAIIEDILECVERGQPSLVGTVSIESSEHLSEVLKKAKIPHAVLNAKFHEKEAEIIANAGAPGRVTIATNMAGRGTDIVLGGNLQVELAAVTDLTEEKEKEITADWQERHDRVVASGGLAIIGTERHESRRIDNQLRGRAGRQGDSGSSRFYLSLEDNLMRLFASERMAGMMKKLGWEQGEAIEHPWVSRAIENAQRKVEARNFDIRKNLLEYDDVANDQRKVIYEQRAELMSTEDISDTVKAIREDVVDDTISQYIPPQSVAEMWDVASLETRLKSDYLLDLPIQKWLDDDDELFEDTLREKIHTKVVDAYSQKEEAVGGSVMRHFEKSIMLQHLDSMWKEHLGAMDHLRQGIHLRGYAQKNPKQEYKREAFELFTQMLDEIKSEVVSILAKVQVKQESDVDAVDQQRRQQSQSQAMNFQHDKASAMGEASSEESEAQEPEEEHVPFVREDRKVGRNEPCPCGSGRKFKQCHGKLA